MSDPLGVVLAGGAGRRLLADGDPATSSAGGPHAPTAGKATATLAGRPLIAYPIAALREALGDVVVAARPDTRLPPTGPATALGSVEVWLDDDGPRHPLSGLVAALRRAAPRPVLVCAVDLPLVDADTVRRLASMPAGGRPAVLASAAGRVQPLLGRYEPGALGLLEGFPPSGRVRDVVGALAPAILDLSGSDVLLNVNAPADLRRAADALATRGASRT